jgi:hypothetical protein
LVRYGGPRLPWPNVVTWVMTVSAPICVGMATAGLGNRLPCDNDLTKVNLNLRLCFSHLHPPLRLEFGEAARCFLVDGS